MKKAFLIIYGILLFVIMSCEDFGNDLKFYNNTKYPYVFSVGLDFFLADTLISFNNFENGVLKKYDSAYYLGHKWEWEHELNYSKTRELTILFLYADSINSYKKKYKTLSLFLNQNKNYKIHSFTKSRLDSCNWRINVTNESIWDPKNY